MKSVCFCLWVLVWIAPARAAVAEDINDLSAEVSLVSDYVFRGFSRSSVAPALQAGLGFQHRSGFIAGAWASTVRFDYDDDFAVEPRRVELQTFVGYTKNLGPSWSGSVRLARYEYPGAGREVDRSYNETSVSLYFRELVSIHVAYTPGFLRSNRSGFFIELAGRYPLPHGFEISAGFGRGEVPLGDVSGFTYGHAAFGWASERFGLDLGYYLSDAPDFPRWGEVADGNLAFIFSTRLP